MRAAPGYEVRLWAATTGTDAWCDALAGEPLYVADGHHRYETALRYRDERRAAAGPWRRPRPTTTR